MLLKKTIIEIIKEYKITPKKRFGQNFIFDNNVLNKIADTITPVRDNLIIEVGPGVGNLTRKLLERKPKNLILIERDSDFKNILDDLLLFFPKTNTKLIFNDFLKVEFDKVELYKNRKVKIISNLPYYISTQILIKVLPFNANLLEVIFMFQKEVADRLLAIPGSKNYSKLTVIVQYCCNINKICDIKSNVFYPKPEVNSSLLRFTKKKSSSNYLLDQSNYLLGHTHKFIERNLQIIR